MSANTIQCCGEEVAGVGSQQNRDHAQVSQVRHAYRKLGNQWVRGYDQASTEDYLS